MLYNVQGIFWKFLRILSAGKRILRLLEFCALKKETGDGTIYLSCVPCEMIFLITK